MENNRFYHTHVEAAIQHAIRIGWKPEARSGEQIGDIDISFVDISDDLLKYASKYLPNIRKQFNDALRIAVEELDLTDRIVGSEWSNNGIEIITNYICDRIMEFNRTHKNIFKSYFTNYVINYQWAPYLGYGDRYSKICYEKILKMAEAAAYVEPVRGTEKLVKGKFTTKSGELTFVSDTNLEYRMKDIQNIIEKCTKDFIDKNVEIMVQIKEV